MIGGYFSSKLSVSPQMYVGHLEVTRCLPETDCYASIGPPIGPHQTGRWVLEHQVSAVIFLSPFFVALEGLEKNAQSPPVARITIEKQI
jgi:hypothetical protein